MSTRDPLDYLTYDDLPESLKRVSHYCGMETVKLMLQYLAGEEIYVPGVKTLQDLPTRYINAEYNGGNVKQLARKLNVSKTYVYQRLREGP